jgi:hypothetical protein
MRRQISLSQKSTTWKWLDRRSSERSAVRLVASRRRGRSTRRTRASSSATIAYV